MTALLFPLAIALTLGIAGLLVVALRRGEHAATVNAAAMLALAFFPYGVHVLFRTPAETGVVLDPRLLAWIAFAGFVHTLGMLGLYERVWWWDHLTHTVSAALVAALVYAALIVSLPSLDWVDDSTGTLLALTAGITFAIGVFWELLELVARDLGERYGIEPILVHYGTLDTAIDLVFDVVGVALVLALDLRIFVPITSQFHDLTPLVLTGSIWTLSLGSALMVVFLGANRTVAA